MAKLWCPICKTTRFNTTTPTQAHINAHLRSAHNHKVTPANEHHYRRLQNAKWKAHSQALDERLRQNTRDRQAEWEAFAAKPKKYAVPTAAMDERLAKRMMILNEVCDDSGSVEDEPEAAEEEEGDHEADSEDIQVHSIHVETVGARDFLRQPLQAVEKVKETDVLRQRRTEMLRALNAYDHSESSVSSGDSDDDGGNDASDEYEEDDDFDERSRKRNRKQ